MNARLRKLIGVFVLLAFLLVYVSIAAAIGSARLAQAHGLVQLVYYLVAGLLWVIPAALLIRWMQRPD